MKKARKVPARKVARKNVAKGVVASPTLQIGHSSGALKEFHACVKTLLKAFPRDPGAALRAIEAVAAAARIGPTTVSGCTFRNGDADEPR